MRQKRQQVLQGNELLLCLRQVADQIDLIPVIDVIVSSASYQCASLFHAGRIPVKNPVTPQKANSGICNSYLPEDSTFNRFIYVVQFLARNNFYLLLDNQFNFDTTAVTDTQGWLEARHSFVHQLNNNAAERMLSHSTAATDRHLVICALSVIGQTAVLSKCQHIVH